MIDKVIAKSNHEFDIFIQHNKKLLNQLFNEQKLTLINNQKRKEQDSKKKRNKFENKMNENKGIGALSTSRKRKPNQCKY